MNICKKDGQGENVKCEFYILQQLPLVLYICYTTRESHFSTYTHTRTLLITYNTTHCNIISLRILLTYY